MRHEFPKVGGEPRSVKRLTAGNFKPGKIRFLLRTLIHPDLAAQPEQEIAERLQIRRRFNAGDPLVENQPPADRLQPGRRNRVGVENSQNRSDRRACAIRVPAEIDRSADRFREISLSQQQRRGDESEIHFDIGKIVAAISAHDPLPDRGKVSGRPAPGHSIPDAVGQGAIRRDHRQTGLNQFFQILLRESAALERCQKLFGIDAVAGVVQLRIDSGQPGGLNGIARRQDGPDFRADGAAQPVGEEIVIDSAPGRRDAELQIPNHHAVFIARKTDVAEPGIREVGA